MKRIKEFFAQHPLLEQLTYMLLISIAIIIVISICLRIYSRHGDEFEMPDFVGQTFDGDSITKYSDDLTFLVLDEISDQSLPNGTITKQLPKAGTKIKKGRQVYVIITTRNQKDVEMPDLTDGCSLKRAVDELYSLGLEVGYVTFDSNNVEYGNNNVSSQTQKPGEKVKSGTRIGLVVTCQMGSKTTIPLVIGETPQDARKRIVSSSLNVGVEHFDNSCDRTNARVYDMKPNTTGRVPYGTTIELWYKSSSSADFNEIKRNYVREAPEPEPEPEEIAPDAINSDNDIREDEIVW